MEDECCITNSSSVPHPPFLSLYRWVLSWFQGILTWILWTHSGNQILSAWSQCIRWWSRQIMETCSLLLCQNWFCFYRFCIQVHFLLLCSKQHAHQQMGGNSWNHQKQLWIRESLKTQFPMGQRYKVSKSTWIYFYCMTLYI